MNYKLFIIQWKEEKNTVQEWKWKHSKKLYFSDISLPILRPWTNRITWLNYTLTSSCKIIIWIYKTYWKLVLTVTFFAKFSLKRSWQTFFIVFSRILHIFPKIFCKIKNLCCMNFYWNLVTWSNWSMALIFLWRTKACIFLSEILKWRRKMGKVWFE